MIVSINQPAYLPWLGYFHRIAVSDVHIVLDHVQFEKKSFTNRNKVRTKDGCCWLTTPLKTKGRFGDLSISQVEIADDQKWAGKHWATMKQCYARTAYFSEHAPFFENVYSHSWTRLSDLLREINEYLLRAFHVDTPLLFSSEMKPNAIKSDLVLELCLAAGATVCLSGPLGRDYLNEASFREAGIKIAYHDFIHPRYDQAFLGFEPYMAAIDLLFNRGPESRAIMQTGNVTREVVGAANA